MNEIHLAPGDIVEVSGERCEIVSWRSLNEVEVKNLSDKSIRTVSPALFKKPQSTQEHSSLSFDMLTEEQKLLAKKRYDIILPLLDKIGSDKKTSAENIAVRQDLSVRTIYVWLARFRRTGKISSLVDLRSTAKSRCSRLPRKQLAIIDRVAREYYETPQKPAIVRAIEKVLISCKDAKIALPGKRAIRQHILMRDPQKAFEHREGRKAAHDRFGAVYGEFPGADYPLSVVQIDHTKVDVELVDDIEKRPIGRPNITIALDVFSRAVLGYFVSFENSSLLTTGLCLEHAMFPKDDWLESLNIKHSWPVWGKPVCLHLDNAMEFRSHGLEDFCGEYGVRLEYRPVKTPHYGGHVERIIRTINERVKTIPGATFSNVRQKGEYASTKQSVITLKDFQQWLGTYITGAYLNQPHSKIGMTPLEKWTQGIRGTENRPGVGVPPILADRTHVRTLLLPTDERVIQRDGIEFKYIKYFSDVLYALFAETRAKQQRKKIRIKYDPRDITSIKVLDEDRKEWFDIPCRGQALPALSLWQWQDALNKTPKKDRNEKKILAVLKEMERIVKNAEKTTKKQRRLNQRLRDANEGETTEKPLKVLPSSDKLESSTENFVPTEKVQVYKSRFL